MTRVRFAVYDSKGRKLGSYRTLFDAKASVPASERHLYKFIPETYTRK